MKPIHVGILGLGTVGSGVFKVLQRNREEIARRAGREIRVTQVSARDVPRVQAIVGADVQVLADPMAIVRSPDVDIVCELMGGTTLAKQLVLAAIDAGKHVVTANKALLAEHGNEIFAAAHRKGVMVAFEAAVAGGIPIIKALREGLTANRIEWLAGIINGTSNFILSEMRDKGMSFEAALADAQRLGYAEADPSFDIDGIDAAHKLTILAAIAFGVPVQFSRAYTEGIAHLAKEDILYAEQLGYRIKLIGLARRAAQGIELRVHPTLVPERRVIANINGAMNAVVVKGDAVGQTLYSGAGAGSEPTASAVIADLVDVTRLQTADPDHRVPHLAFQADALADTPILPIDDVVTAYYLRLRVADEPGVLATLARILADAQISIDAVLQKEAAEEEHQTDLIVLTHRTVEREMNRALAQMQRLPSVMAPIVRIRLEQLN
ncbi:MAG: homoserine dehydrogenase [Betaproteobacteria bacterium]|nr:homoserine dehydrogenase [Betaproteobacteria bacterium]